jgi:hypothetical protein
MSITTVNLQDNRAVFRIFIALLILNSYSDGDEHSGSVIKNFPHQFSKSLQLKQRPGTHRYAVTFDQSLGKKVTSATTRLIFTHKYVFTKVLACWNVKWLDCNVVG